MKTKIEKNDRTPVSETFKIPVRVITIGSHGDPATEEDIALVDDFLKKLNKHITIQYMDEYEVKNVSYIREYD